jgi:hypothetical protein
MDVNKAYDVYPLDVLLAYKVNGSIQYKVVQIISCDCI